MGQGTSSTPVQNALGVYRLVSSHFSAIAPADHPERETEIRLLIKILGPAYRPLWATNTWRSPNGGLIQRSHHLVGHYETTPTTSRRSVKGLVLPTTNLYGIEWRNPIYVDDVLDGLTNDERALVGRSNKRENVPGKRRVLPRYEPIDSRVIRSCHYGIWRTDNERIEEQVQAALQAIDAKAEKVTKDLIDYGTYAEKHDRVYDGQRIGTIGRVVIGEKFTHTEKPAEAAL